MAFLSNRNVNYLNIHLAVMNLLDQSFTVFCPLYLYAQGFSIPGVFGTLALLIGLRLPMRLLSFPVIRRCGLKATTMIGATGYGLSFPVLGLVTRFGDRWMWLYVALYAVFNSMHWFAYHTFYTLAGEQEKRGRQVATGQALSITLAAIAPLLGAAVITKTGFEHYFLAAFVLIVLMLASLSKCDNITVPSVSWREGRKAFFGLGAKIHLLESSAQYPLAICWLFVVYLYVGKIMSLGGIIAFGIVAQVLWQLTLGALVDRGRGTHIVNVAGSLRVITILGRAFLPLSLPIILGLETVAAAASVHHTAVEPTVLYNAGKQYSHPLWYWLFAESAWDLGTLTGTSISATLLLLGVSLRHVILVAFPFTLLLWWLLRRYFVRNPYAELAAP